MNSENIHVYGLTSGHCQVSIHDLLELWAHKQAAAAVAYTMVKVGGSVDQGPTTEVTPS